MGGTVNSLFEKATVAKTQRRRSGPGRPFAQGVSCNPAGPPKGYHYRVTRLAERDPGDRRLKHQSLKEEKITVSRKLTIARLRNDKDRSNQAGIVTFAKYSRSPGRFWSAMTTLTL